MSPFDLQYIGSFQVGNTFSSETPLEEVWSHVARWGIEDWVKALAVKQSPPITVPWSDFGPYATVRVRQAVEFRAAARQASLLTAPLPFYYSFLNLERGFFAFGEQRKPSRGHGLIFVSDEQILDCAARIDSGTFADYLTTNKVSFTADQRISLREALARIPELLNDLYNASALQSEVIVCEIKATHSGSVVLKFSVPDAAESDFRTNWQTLYPLLAPDCDLEPSGAALKVKSSVDSSDYGKIALFLSKRLEVPLVIREDAYWFAVPASSQLPTFPRAAWYLVSMFILGSMVRYEPEILAKVAGQNSELQWILSRYLRVAERFYPQLKLMEIGGRNLFF